MRRGVAVILVLMFPLLLVPAAKAEQVLHLGFDGLLITTNLGSRSYTVPSNTAGPYDFTTLVTSTISLPTQKYLSSLYITLDVSSPSSHTKAWEVRVLVNGNVVKDVDYSWVLTSETYEYTIPLTGYYDDSFTIVVEFKANDGNDWGGTTLTATIHNAVTTNEDYGVKTTLTDLKYIPPGAENTPSALILNRTEVALPQSYTLSQGAITFWLKWDGSPNIKISDNIGIDANGYLYVKNDAGTTYTLEGVTPPVGQYVPVYISWEGGNGYIMLNTTKITLNWVGNLVISKISDITNNAATLIDEFKLWDTYIPADQIVLLSQKEQYALVYGNQTITIEPEGGQTLGTIDVSFLDADMNTLNTTSLSAGDSVATIPANTSMIVLTRGTASRTFLLDKVPDTIAFPAVEAESLLAAKLQVMPGTWDVLQVKTASGGVVTREKLNNNVATVVVIPGNSYLITFERGSESITRFATITGDMVFYILEDKTVIKPPVDFQVRYNPDDRLIEVYYYDSNLETEQVNVTVEGVQGFSPAWAVSDSQTGAFGLYKLTTGVNNTDYVRVTLNALVNGTWQEYTKVVPTGAGGNSPFPTTMVPPFLLVAGAALIPFFLSKGTEPWLMLLGGAVGLTLAQLLGWVPSDATIKMLTTALTVLGVLAMLSRGGE